LKGVTALRDAEGAKSGALPSVIEQKLYGFLFGSFSLHKEKEWP